MDMAKSNNSYDNHEINYGFDSQSRDNNHNIQRDKEDRNNNNFSVAALTNSDDKRIMIAEGH